MRSRTVSTPSSASRPALRSDTDSSTDTSRRLRSLSVRPLLNPQQVRVEGLAAPVPLERDVGILLRDPLLDHPPVRGARALALNEGHQLVRRLEQAAEEQAGADDDVVGDGHDAVARNADEVALVHLAGV